SGVFPARGRRSRDAHGAAREDIDGDFARRRVHGCQHLYRQCAEFHGLCHRAARRRENAGVFRLYAVVRRDPFTALRCDHMAILIKQSYNSKPYLKSCEHAVLVAPRREARLDSAREREAYLAQTQSETGAQYRASQGQLTPRRRRPPKRVYSPPRTFTGTDNRSEERRVG